MNKRSEEKYQINFANTERLRRASVITMQKLINLENE